MTDVGPQEIPGGFDAPDAGGGVAAGGQEVGEGHREAGGVGGGDEFFGVGSGSAFEAGAEGVGVVQDAAVGANVAFAFG